MSELRRSTLGPLIRRDGVCGGFLMARNCSIRPLMPNGLIFTGCMVLSTSFGALSIGCCMLLPRWPRSPDCRATILGSIDIYVSMRI